MYKCILGRWYYGWRAVITSSTITFSCAPVVYTCGLLARQLILRAIEHRTFSWRINTKLFNTGAAVIVIHREIHSVQ